MAVTFTKIYTDRVKVSPKTTLGDGTEVTDYVDAMVMEIQGVSGSLSATRGEWELFAVVSGCTFGKWGVKWGP